MLIVEHDIDRVLGFSQRVTVMNQGEVLMAGTPGEVRNDRRVQEVYTGTGIPPVTGRASEGAGARAGAAVRGRQRLLRQEPHPQRRDAGRARGRDRGAARPQRRGQVDAAEDAGRPGAAGLRAASNTQGRDIAGLPAPDIARLGIGYVPQGRGLFAGMTVADNLALGRLARATDGSTGVVWSEEQILEYFPRLKERMHIAADYLSGGEQQMVAVARAHVGQRQAAAAGRAVRGAGAGRGAGAVQGVRPAAPARVSIVIVEHNLDLVLALADRVFALERGAVFHEGPAAPLLNDLDYRKKILWLN